MPNKPDYTKIAVSKQLNALGCDNYEVGIVNGHCKKEDAKMIIIPINKQKIYDSLKYYRKMNVTGHHIFIRPLGSQGLIFFDDLSMSNVRKMTSDGYAPALLIESSPDNYHGWIRVSETPIPTDVATAVSKVIAKKYDGDNDAAAWRQFGRIAGFTNQKPKHVDETGRYPYVNIKSSIGRLCAAHETLMAEAFQYLEEKRLALEEKSEEIKKLADNPRITDLESASNFFKRSLDIIKNHYGASLYASKADWMIVTDMIKKGFSIESIKHSMMLHSLEVSENEGKKDVTKYINATVENAFLKI